MSLNADAIVKTPLNKLTRADIRAFVKEALPPVPPEVEALVEALLTIIEKLWADNEHKQFKLMKLIRAQFGRKSEKLDPAQLALFVAELTAEVKADSEEPSPELAPVPKPPEPEAKPPRIRTGRNPLPKDLPREVIRLMPKPEDQVCAQCGQAKSCIGHDSSELLEYVPAYLKVRVYERVKMACRSCEAEVSIAPAPDKPIEQGRPGPGLLAFVTVSKYVDHTPLYRLKAMLARYGVDIPESTLGSWVTAVVDMLKPLYEKLCEKTLTAYVLGVDDTPLPVLDNKEKPAIKRGHLWAYVGYEALIPVRMVYRYTPDWRGENACTYLNRRWGYIQGDGYAGIDRLFGIGQERVRVGCMAHCRRKFVEALDAGDKRAAQPLEWLGRLYEVERLAKGQNAPPEERLKLRSEYSRPAMDLFWKWLTKMQAQVEPKSPLGKAVTYAVNQWQTLNVYLSDGAVPIDNNRVEQHMRPVALGRKNYLFAGSDAGAERAAVLYSLVACCRLAELEPFAYLREVLDRLSRGWPNSRLAELLPEHFKLDAVLKEAA